MDAAELFRDSLLEFRLIFLGLGIFVSPPFSQPNFKKSHSFQRADTKYLFRWALLMLTPPVEKAGGSSAGEGRIVSVAGEPCCL